MMRTLKMVVAATMALGGLGILASDSLAKAEYTKKEKKACVTCHVSAKSKELNEIGKCYQKNNHSLEGCEPKKAREKKS